MGVGGATWDTAGTLDLGSGNTFDLADVTEEGDGRPFNRAWWTYTSDVALSLTVDSFRTTGGNQRDTYLAIYTGDTQESAVLVVSSDDSDGLLSKATFSAEADVTYHVVVGTFDLDGPGVDVTTYRLNASKRDFVYTDWSTQFQDRDDNRLVISGDQVTAIGDLQLENPPGLNDAWFPRALRSVTAVAFPLGDDFAIMFPPPGRRGNYRISEVFGGADPIGAASCAWEHTHNGDEPPTVYWNSDPTDSDHQPGDPICLPVFPDVPAEPHDNGAVAYSLDYGPGGFLIAKSMEGAERMAARGLWALPVRDNLPVWGVLDVDDIDPVAAGLPPGYPGSWEIEWEDGLELTALEYQGDRADRASTVTIGTRIFLNDKILPGYGEGDPDANTPGVWQENWTKGAPGTPLTGDTRPYDDFVYTNEASEWREYPDITSFEDCSNPVFGPPDVTVGLSVDGIPVVDAPTYTSTSDIAFRFTLRAPRFRIRYLPPEVTTVTRQEPRSPDALGLSTGTRIFPAPTAGRIYGGDQ